MCQMKRFLLDTMAAVILFTAIALPFGLYFAFVMTA